MSADSTLRLRYPTGANLYTQIEAPDGTFWNGTAYTTFSVASWATFAVNTPETPASSGRYVAQFPTSSAAGFYTWATYLRAGGSPASSDVCVGNGAGYWDGATFGNTGAVANIETQVFDTPQIGGGTFRQAVRAMSAALAGNLTQSSDGTTDTFTDFADSNTTRITSTNNATTRSVTVH